MLVILKGVSIMRLEHVNITVRDVEQSYRFYQRVLGFEQRWKGEIEGDNKALKAMHVGNEDLYLSLFEAEREGGLKADYRTLGVNHFAFVVEDLGPYRERLAAEGLDIHLEQDYEPGHRLYFYDLDGYEIELVSY